MKRLFISLLFLALMMFPLRSMAGDYDDNLNHSIAVLKELGAHIEKDDDHSSDSMSRKIPFNGSSYALLDDQNKIIKIDRIEETNEASFRNNTAQKDYKTTQSLIEKEIIKSEYALKQSGYFDDHTIYLRYEKTTPSDERHSIDAYDVYIDTKNGALVSLKKKQAEGSISADHPKYKKSIQTFYLDDTLYVKLRDFANLYNEQKDDAVLYDNQTGAILINMEKHTKGKASFQCSSVNDVLSKKPIKSTNSVVIRSHMRSYFSKKNQDAEAIGLNMLLMNGSNYVSAEDICALYGISMTQKDGAAVLYFDSFKQNDFKEMHLNNQTISYRGLDLEYLTDDPERSKCYKLFGHIEENISKIIAENVTNDEPKDLLKNAPGEGTFILTAHQQNKEDLTFMLIPENKIDGKYYLDYRFGNQPFQHKYLKTNIIENIRKEIA